MWIVELMMIIYREDNAVNYDGNDDMMMMIILNHYCWTLMFSCWNVFTYIDYNDEYDDDFDDDNDDNTDDKDVIEDDDTVNNNEDDDFDDYSDESVLLY